MLELYYFPAATCGLKARLTAEEKGVEYVSRVLNRDKGDLNSPDYRALNPKGVVPTLVHDGKFLTESSVIMRYFDDAFSGPDLMPHDAMDRAHCNFWMQMADESYLPSLGVLTYAIHVRHRVLKKNNRERSAYYNEISDPERRARRITVVEHGIAAPPVASAARQMVMMVKTIEATLAKSRFLAGPDWSLADAAITPFVERLHQLGGLWLDNRPCIEDWWERIVTRPSYQSTIESQRDSVAEAEMRENGLKAMPLLLKLIGGQND